MEIKKLPVNATNIDSYGNGFLFVVSRHLLTVILILHGGTGGKAVITRAQKVRNILTTEL